MTDDDPRGRLERALDRAPTIAEEVDPLGFEWREEAAERILAGRVLPDVVVGALADLYDEDRDALADIRLIVAALEPEHLLACDMTILRAVAVGQLAEAVGVIAFLLRTSARPSRAAEVFSSEYAALLDVAG